MGGQGSEGFGTFVDGGRDVFSGPLDQDTPTHALLPIDMVDLEAHRCEWRMESLGSLVGLEDDGLTIQGEPHWKHEGRLINHYAEPSQPLGRHERQALVTSEFLKCTSLVHVASFLPYRDKSVLRPYAIRCATM
jgi:hypothetical protein